MRRPKKNHRGLRPRPPNHRCLRERKKSQRPMGARARARLRSAPHLPMCFFPKNGASVPRPLRLTTERKKGLELTSLGKGGAILLDHAKRGTPPNPWRGCPFLFPTYQGTCIVQNPWQIALQSSKTRHSLSLAM